MKMLTRKQIKFGEWTSYFRAVIFPIQLVIIAGTSVMLLASLIMVIIDNTWSDAIWYLSGFANNLCFLLITLLSNRAFRKRIKTINNEVDDYRIPLYYFRIWWIVISIFNMGFTFANIFLIADNGNLDTCQFIIMGTGFFWSVYICAILPLYILMNRYVTPKVKLSNKEFAQLGIKSKNTKNVSKAISENKSKREIKKELAIGSWKYKLAVNEIREKAKFEPRK